MPHATIFDPNTPSEKLVEDPLTFLDPMYRHLHYGVTCDKLQFNGNCFFWNPTQVAKVRPVTAVDKAEHLCIEKKFEEALDVLKSQKQLANVVIKEHPKVLENDLKYDRSLQDVQKKVQNGYLELLLKEEKYAQMTPLFPKFLSNNGERWTHWINKMIQKKKLQFILPVIYKASSKLSESKMAKLVQNPTAKNPYLPFHEPVDSKVELKVYNKIF